MHLGILGCGAVGQEVAQACLDLEGITAISAWDISRDAISDMPAGVRAVERGEDLLECDLLVECASQAAVTQWVRPALAAGTPCIILTVGALSDDQLRADLIQAARQGGCKLYVPSGAIMGLDGVMAASTGDLKSVTLVTTKPNAGLDREVDRWTLLFNGTARDAVEAFPKNVNVAAALSLAGIGFDDTWVQVAVDPLAERNSHKVILEGDFGRARIEVENLPSPTNPRTSRLAALSTVALLKRILSPIEIGA